MAAIDRPTRHDQPPVVVLTHLAPPLRDLQYSTVWLPVSLRLRRHLSSSGLHTLPFLPAEDFALSENLDNSRRETLEWILASAC